MYEYFAQFIPQKDGNIDVYFPDIEVATYGKNLKEAISMAEDALRIHIEACLEEKDPISPPTSLSNVREKAEKNCKELGIEITKETFYQYIQIEIMDKPVRVNLSFAPKILQLIDKNAKVYGLTRSAFLTVAAQNYVNKSM